MNIAFIHYHLMRGGVTTVIRHQVEALRDAGWNVLLLAGGPRATNFPAKVLHLPELGYVSAQSTDYSSENISKKIISAIEKHWPHGADVVHVHNPTLAKNPYLQEVLHHLRQSGIRLLCQIHDFAEDGRPNAYFRSPYVGDCHYAVINQRDHRLLLDAGLKPEGCHLLPNAIAPLGDVTPRPSRHDYVLYPIRAIRRKNIGEALLLTLFFDQGTDLAITLPPNSDDDVRSYDDWRRFARRRHLPVRFGVGLQADFVRLMADCRFVLTTSITEGFGFTFLEPWTMGKALWGRLLPDTCRGFIEKGVDLNHLYPRLQVDLAWLDVDHLAERWKAALIEAWRQYRIELRHEAVEASWQLASRDGRIDFGLLSEPFQQKVIGRIMDDASAAERLRSLNPFLQRPGPPDVSAPVIRRNSDIISNSWHLDRYGPKLMAVYRAVVDTSVRHTIDKRVISKFFLSPSSFSLLKWEPFDG